MTANRDEIGELLDLLEDEGWLIEEYEVRFENQRRVDSTSTAVLSEVKLELTKY